MILKRIKAEFPRDSVVAEEGGGGIDDVERCWFIDPLDGTKEFIDGNGEFTVNIALIHQHRAVMGVVYNPVSEELFWAQAGCGAYLNDEKIAVSKIADKENSLLATGFPADTSTAVYNNLEIFKELTNSTHGVRRDGSAALDLCYVACGRLDAFWEMKLSPWDVAAGSLIVSEAGGSVTNLINGTFDKQSGHILASNGLIHDQIVAILKTFNAVKTAHGI